ncbi:histidine-containing response regulator phosphotransferase Mpr1 [Kluyveromyces marxianus]|uniref:Acetyltransferases n=2 Tax=Kluyveromyces marxianus TaxID=4911 RepID=W0T6G2_KLUMD|nr:acetyltransferase [Kluyveromyces marxianus DMKU3-1042]KAG0677217.1 histidine-containing response regulator phosphotransferase Mpr1 [Kluyveromyces marxianus]KAG0679849.1 histidine-containing response regulator phosphotransferase Mpr1 [Kluyveromyces marxianus]QGN14392.1 acetyltransferases [Kluyveromyces marxianus]BAO38653.1 acetyltransferases [Kluyveromyces marxianus DMKU3-1042]BAP70199.1 acetyltransferases [Kluyveromyces marxianus]
MSTANLRNGAVFSKPIVDKIEPLQFHLKDSDKVVTAFAVLSPEEVPESLVDFLYSLFNKELDAGQTYPQVGPLTREQFVDYWFHSATVVLLDTTQKSIDPSWNNWEELVLGTFYIKPNYAGRCSHNCNAGFLVNPVFRGKKVGYRLGQVYLKWAPLLGYKYSVFNLVFVTNVASWKIWDKLKFSRIGYIPKVAVLKGFDEPVDAIMFGKDLTNVEPELFEDLS